MSIFLSWNCRGSRTKLNEIKSLISIHQPVCVALQETFLKPTDSFKIRRYSSVRFDNDSVGRASGGVSILTRHDFPSNTINLRTVLQAVAVQVHVRRLITVCCLYLPPNVPINQHTL